MKLHFTMAKWLLAGTLALLLSGPLYAQETTETEPVAVSSFFAEMGGAGLMFSANYDRRFSSINRLNRSHLGPGFRVGLGFYNNDSWLTGDPRSIATIPVQLNYIFGKPVSPHTFEVGAGVTFAGHKIYMDYYDREAGGHSVFITTTFMYRRQPVHGGFSWRAGFTPLLYGGYIEPFGGIGFGYNF